MSSVRVVCDADGWRVLEWRENRWVRVGGASADPGPALWEARKRGF